MTDIISVEILVCKGYNYLGGGFKMVNCESKTCCFTGHRKIPPENFDEISRRLENMIIQLIENGYVCFCAGGALGFDMLAAQTVIKLKMMYPYIKLILILPCKNQAEY